LGKKHEPERSSNKQLHTCPDNHFLCVQVGNNLVFLIPKENFVMKSKQLMGILTFILVLAACRPSEADRLFMGQTPPGAEVDVFAPGIVSIEDGKEYKITFSPDLQEILFTRRTPNGRNDRIWYSRLEKGELTPPELAPFACDCLEMDPSFTPDGRRVYYNSKRPLPGEESLSDRFNVWYVDRTANGWSEPQFVGSPFNDYHPVYFSFANDGTLYFTNSSPREIWYAQPTDDGYGEAQQLPSLINLLPNVAHPGIAPDGSYIVVDSYVYKDGVLVGSLYVSYRKPDGFWTKPVRLAEILNAEETDIYASPRISPDGEFLFFEHYLPETDQADICWVSTEIITGSLLE
jgi:Tol biopolymer transport system component